MKELTKLDRYAVITVGKRDPDITMIVTDEMRQHIIEHQVESFRKGRSYFLPLEPLDHLNPPTGRLGIRRN